MTLGVFIDHRSVTRESKLDLGLNRDDPRESMYAFRDALERRVDYATVNDRFFVNNVSLGVYAKIVQEESYRDAKVDTTKVLLPEMLGRPLSVVSLPASSAPAYGSAKVHNSSHRELIETAIPAEG